MAAWSARSFRQAAAQGPSVKAEPSNNQKFFASFFQKRSAFLPALF
jgi:hypothetical protein